MRFGTLMLFGLFCCTACASSTGTEAPNTKRVTGYIRYYPFEGGFYALRGDDSVTYEPTNLAKRFQGDGMQFQARLRIRTGGQRPHGGTSTCSL